MITFWASIIVLISIGLVAWPLLKGTSGRIPQLVEDTEVSELLSQKDATLFAISELESDFNMGNLSQSDYQELRHKYEEKAVALMKTADGLRSEREVESVDGIDKEIEARVAFLRAARDTDTLDVAASPANIPAVKKGGRRKTAGKACPACGAPLEADDQFCFRCGAASSAKCPGCGAEIGADDQFCFKCGAVLDSRRDRAK
jgi:predicted nucleic acid-binding Zn ribbon protein